MQKSIFHPCILANEYSLSHITIQSNLFIVASYIHTKSIVHPCILANEYSFSQQPYKATCLMFSHINIQESILHTCSLALRHRPLPISVLFIHLITISSVYNNLIEQLALHLYFCAVNFRRGI
jgi:hypothetical protein